ncbi:hypothetical protein H6P81_003654 [Aristolochia fimbriata]|uniref:ATP synthase F0 subunit 8 n=1 Tax=Aristolochia fimbriata TaxID=158543 RepID=A0AAV7FGC6_ARIFI|nr:hypothetical protein H6P81_003654 [Aristolochia fimbriata]
MALALVQSGFTIQVNGATKNLTASKGWLKGNNINLNHVDLFYWLLAILSFLNFFNYLYWAKWYKHRSQEGITRKVMDANKC